MTVGCMDTIYNIILEVYTYMYLYINIWLHIYNKISEFNKYLYECK